MTASTPREPLAMNRRLAAINSISSVAAHIINITLVLWVQQYLLSHISVEEYSLFPIVAAPMVLVPLLFSLLTGGLGRFVVEAWSKKDQRRVTEIVSTMAAVTGVAAVGLTIFGFLSATFITSVVDIDPALRDDTRWMIVLLSVSAAIRLTVAPFSVGLWVRQHFLLANLVALGVQALRLLLLLALLFGLGPRVIWVVVATVTAEIVGTAIRAVASRRLVDGLVFRRNAVSRTTAREIVAYSTWNLLPDIARGVRLALIPILLTNIVSVVAVTCYHLGTLVFRHTLQLTMIATQPLAPPLVTMHAQRDESSIRRVYLTGGRFALWLTTLIGTPLMIFHREASRLYINNPDVDADLTGLVMFVALIQLPLTYGNAMMGRVAQAKHQVRPLARRMLIVQVTALLLSIGLVVWSDLGALAPVLGSLIAVVALHPTIVWPFAHRLAGVTRGEWLRRTVVPGLTPAVVGSVVWIGLRVLVQPDTWVALAACAAAGGVVFAAAMVRFGMRGDERRDMWRALSRPWRYRITDADDS